MHALVFRTLTAVLIAAFASGCETPRPQDNACMDMSVPQRASAKAFGIADASAERMAEAVGDRIAQTVRGKRGLRDAGRAELHVLTLSAGGQWGAFGAGFIAGLSETPARRPDFNVVTGVSTGAIMAPFVFAGAHYDPRLRAEYRGLSQERVYRKRGLGTLIAPSLYDISPAEQRLRGYVDANLLADLRNARGDGRSLVLGAVNLDSGRFEPFDIMGLDLQGQAAETCIEEAVLASAAIPLAFPPRHINGALYVDGGARKHVFFPAVERARAKLGIERSRVTAYIIVNGNLIVPETMTPHSLLEIGGRSFSIVVDETLRQSIVEAIDDASALGWTVVGISARDVDIDDCPGAEDTFDACVTEQLYDAGFALGSKRPIPWKNANELRRDARAYLP